MNEVVYFLQGPGRIKVGYSRKLAGRIATIRAHSVEEITLIGSIKAGLSVERAIHARLKPFKVKGEWYRDCEEVRGLIRLLLKEGYEAVVGKVSDKHRIETPKIESRWASGPLVRMIEDAASLVVNNRLIREINQYGERDLIAVAVDVARATTIACERLKSPGDATRDSIMDEYEAAVVAAHAKAQAVRARRNQCT